jgi:hypothetical protein
MSHGAGVWSRMVAGLQGQVSVDALEAYRQAGSTVYDLLDRVQRRRDEARLGGRSPWEADRGLQFQIAFAWNAFVLQTLGDELVAACVAGAGAAGFLPRVTADQAAAFYQQVEPWVSRANQAATNPAYEPDVLLPAELPHWVEVQPCPRAHVVAMVAAVRSIQGRAEIAVGTFEAGAVPEPIRQRFGLVQQRIADADTAADYALRLWAGDPSGDVYDQVEQHVKAALEGYYVAGQMLAVPSLAPTAGRVEPLQRQIVAAPPLPGPDRVGFDPWCLTDPRFQARAREDERVRSALDEMWRRDPDPRTTLHLQALINRALAVGAVELTGLHYHRCPWSAIYLVKQPVQIGERRLRALQEFTYAVSTEDGQLKRQLVIGTFAPTRRPAPRPPADDGGDHWRPPPFPAGSG